MITALSRTYLIRFISGMLNGRLKFVYIWDDTIGWQLTSSLIAIDMFPLSLIIYKIFAKQIKCHKFYLENKGQG